MDIRSRLYISGIVGASLSYVANVLVFAGRFDPTEWAVFAALFFVLFSGLEQTLIWTELRNAN